MYYMERVWKEKRDILIANGVNDLKAWAYCGNTIICDLNSTESFGVQACNLSLVCLFND